MYDVEEMIRKVQTQIVKGNGDKPYPMTALELMVLLENVVDLWGGILALKWENEKRII